MSYPTFGAVFRDPDQVAFLKEQGYDLEDAIDQPSRTTERLAIHDAAWEGRLEMVGSFLGLGIDVDITDPRSCKGKTPLSVALAARQDGLAKLLINNGADVEKTDAIGEFPLVQWARGGLELEEDILLCLIHAGANLNQENLTSTALTKTKFTPDLLPVRHMTALMYAINIGAMSTALLLIEHGASLVNSQGRTIFEYYSSERAKRLVKETLERQQAITGQLDTTLKEQAVLPTAVQNMICSYTPGYYYSPSLFYHPRTADCQQEKAQVNLASV